MKNLRKQDDYWKPCRPGTILRASDSNFSRQRRKFLIQSTMAGAVAATSLFATIFAFSHRKGDRLAESEGITDGSRSESNSFDGTLVQNNNSIENSRKVYRITCGDVKHDMEKYLVAYRLDSKNRTLDQNNLIDDFAQHLSICHKCQAIATEALQSV